MSAQARVVALTVAVAIPDPQPQSTSTHHSQPPPLISLGSSALADALSGPVLICSSANINLPIDLILPPLFGQALAVPWSETVLEVPAHVWIDAGGVEGRSGGPRRTIWKSSGEERLTL